MDLYFDLASGAMESPRATFGRGCFAPRQASSFTGDMAMTWQSGPTPGFLLSGSVTGGPMNRSTLFGLLGIKALANPIPLGPSGCSFLLDPGFMLVLGPRTMDLAGGHLWPTMGTLPVDPALGGVDLYGQFAAVNSDWMDDTIYMSNAVRMQFPLVWGSGAGPAVSTIYARGAGATTATTGTLVKGSGLVIMVGP